MPKERRTHSGSRASSSPYSGACSHHKGSCSSSSRSPLESSVEAATDMKAWDEVRCPVCMEYPHNAVLLTCSAGGKGCQPFMCDTSYRHSNCLDQYKKTSSESSSLEKSVDGQEQSKLSCPLCRGEVTGWTVVEAARKYMNCKVRSCSTESCGFTGSYGELRKHARKEHPSVKPSEADPERQRDWRRMEQRRDLGDLFSSMQSAMSGEDGGLGAMSGEDEGFFIEDEEDLGMSSFPNPLTVYLIFRISSIGGVSRGWTTLRSTGGQASRILSWSRRVRGGNLPGEIHSEPQADDTEISSGNTDDEDEDDDEDEGDDDGAAESNEVSAASRQGRGRHQLRMPDEDNEGDNDVIGGSNAVESNEGAAPSRRLRGRRQLMMPDMEELHDDDVTGESNEAAAAPTRRGRGRPRRQLRITDDETSSDGVL